MVLDCQSLEQDKEAQMIKKILIIEDDPNMLKLLKYNMEKHGYCVVAAESGKEGLRLARQENVDLLIVDVLLPGMDGFTICRMLRYDDNYKHLPIIALTGQTSDKDKATGREVGVNVYLTKPYKLEDLLEKIRGLLGETS